MFVASALLACYLTAAVAAPVAASISTDDTSSLWGTWELTGIGQPDNRATVTPDRMAFVFESGGWREILWEKDGDARNEFPGSYTLSGDVLELTGPRNYVERFRATWSPSSLMLERIEESTKLSPPFYFEKRAVGALN